MRIAPLLLLSFLTLTTAAQHQKADSLIAAADKETVDTLKAKCLNMAVSAYVWDNKPAEATSLAQTVKKLAGTSRIQRLQLARNYIRLAGFYVGKSRFDEAWRCSDTAQTMRSRLQDEAGLCDAINYKGIVKWYTGDFDKALALYMDALKKAERLRDTALYLKIYNNIGIVYYSLKRLELSITYYKKVLQFVDSVKSPVLFVNTLDNIGLDYTELARYDEALAYHLRALANKERQPNNAVMLSTSYINIGNVFYKKKVFQRALYYYEKAREIKEVQGDLNGLVHCHNDISSVYMALGKYEAAKTEQLKGLALAKTIDVKDLVKELLKGLSESSYHVGDYKAAFDYYKRYSEIKDSLFSSESNLHITEMETKYQTEKKEQENKLLKQQNDLQQLESEKKDSDLKKQRAITLSVSVGLALMVVLIVIVLKGYRDKQRANDIISKQKQLVEEKQKEIVDSIHYAQRIQRALITSEKYIERELKKLAEEK